MQPSDIKRRAGESQGLSRLICISYFHGRVIIGLGINIGENCRGKTGVGQFLKGDDFRVAGFDPSMQAAVSGGDVFIDGAFQVCSNSKTQWKSGTGIANGQASVRNPGTFFEILNELSRQKRSEEHTS